MSNIATHSRILLSAVAAFAFTQAARADVLVVNASGGGDHVEIATAVAAAADGDTLLVKSGTYLAFTIDGKSLSVVADSGAVVVVNGTMGVKNLMPAQTVVLSGLVSVHASSSSSSGDPTFGVGLSVTACEGAVRAQACQFEGRFGSNAGCFQAPALGRAGVYVGTSTNVAFVGCAMRGGDGGGHAAQCWCGSDGRIGGNGLTSQSSLVALYDCTMNGGKGGRGAEVGGNGGDGARVQGTLGMFASHSFFFGGNGGTADAAESDPSGLCVLGYGGDGGAGLQTIGPVTVKLVGGTFVGGAGGVPLFGGQTGAAGSNQSGSGIFTLQGPPRVLVAPAVARENTSVTLTFYGQAGDEVFLRESRQTGFREMPLLNGVLLTKNPHPEHIAIIGTIPASGALDWTIPLSDLGAGVEARSLFLQAQFKNSEGTTGWLASFAAMTEIDSSF